MTVRDALLEAATHIPRRDAETLFAHTLHRDRPWLLAHPCDPIDPPALESFRSLVTRRAAHEPLQHLTGIQEFFGLPLRVTPDVLIPRPETEHLVEAVLDWVHTQHHTPHHARTTRGPQPAPQIAPKIVDVGTGSGAIALALAAHLPDAPEVQITAIDLSPAALAVARYNAHQLGLTHRVSFLEGDLLAPVQGALFDIIVSNPPYVPEPDAPTLQPEVRDHEPALALYGGHDGLEVFRRLIPQAFNVLRSGGLLALEIGFNQRAPLAALLHAWNHVHFLNDYAHIPRIALAEKRP